jgi:hypothetical protein
MTRNLTGRFLFSLSMSALFLVACQKPDPASSDPEVATSSIRDIDFQNFTYPYVESRKYEQWERLDPEPRIVLKGGRHDFPDGDYLLFQSASYGDLDGDGIDEAAVDLLYGTGGTQNWHYVYVFEENAGVASLVSRFVSGSRADGGLVHMDIRSNRLLLDLQDEERRTADCCSRGSVRLTFRLNGGAFEEIPPRIKDSFRTRVYPNYTEDPGSVGPFSGSNIWHIDTSGTKHLLTHSENDGTPSLSFDRKLVVFIRSKKEVWTVEIDGTNERKVFSCTAAGDSWSCDSPKFSPDGKTIYVIREVEGEKGGVWKVDIETGKAALLIPDSAQFVVLKRGKNSGFLLADQRTMRPDSAGVNYPRYPFFLFTPEGAKHTEVGADDAHIFDLAASLER